MKILEKNNKIYLGIVFLIFIMAAILRIVGIGWGMPYNNLHPDEGLIYAESYNCVLNHDFEVKQYYRPNHVLIKLNTLLFLGIQELYFQPQGETSFETNYVENFPLFIVASRMIIVLFSMGIVFLAYKIALFWGRKYALFSATLFAVFPSFLEHSHYITPDIPILFFLMCVLLMGLYYYKKPSVHCLFFMSLFTAFGFCEKYTGAYGCAIIFTVICVTHYKKPFMILKEGFLAILFFILGILAISPILIVDYKTVLEVMAGQNKQYHLGADGLNFGQTILFYLKTSATRMGLILTLSSIYGMIKVFKKDFKVTLILLTFFAYIVPISILKVHWERYALPIYAILLLFATYGVFSVFEDVYKVTKKNRILSIAISIFLFVLPIGSLTVSAGATVGSFLAPDSRIFLKEVFEGMNVSPNNTVYDCNTPLDPGGFYGAFSNFEGGDPAKYKYGGSPRFVMTSSGQRDLYLEADPSVYGWIAEFYKKLDKEYPLVYLRTVENPSYHFLEFENVWYSARSIYRYMKGAVKGYEIRLYQLTP